MRHDLSESLEAYAARVDIDRETARLSWRAGGLVHLGVPRQAARAGVLDAYAQRLSCRIAPGVSIGTGVPCEVEHD